MLIIKITFPWFDNNKRLCRNYELTFDSAEKREYFTQYIFTVQFSYIRRIILYMCCLILKNLKSSLAIKDCA